MDPNKECELVFDWLKIKRCERLTRWWFDKSVVFVLRFLLFVGIFLTVYISLVDARQIDQNTNK